MEKTNNALSFRETGLHINPLNAELNPTCHLLALLGGATIVVVSRLRVKILDYVHDDNDDDDNDDDNDLNLFDFTKFITVCVNAKTAHSSRCFFFSKSVFRN